MKRETLPAELVWQEDGHLGDVALTALADGQDAILPAGALDHVACCEACARRLGDAAVAAIDCAAAVVAAPAPAPLSSRATRLPVFAIAAALVLAAIGAIPYLVEVPALFESAKWFVAHGIAHVSDVITKVLGNARLAQTIGALSVASTVVLVLAGIYLARTRAQKPRQGALP